MTVDAVVFDIGNVLIEWQPERYYDRTMGEQARRALFAEVDLHAMNDEIDKGAHFRDVIYATAEANPAHREAIRRWFDDWIVLASPVIPQSVRCLRALRAKGIPVFSLTNFGIQSFDYATSIYRFLEEFDKSYVSGHMGVIKPDPVIYQMVEDDCGVAPGGLLFADDRADNIAEAARRGWQTHLFTSPQGWADRLVAEGLLDIEDTRP